MMFLKHTSKYTCKGKGNMQTVFGDVHWILLLWVYLQRACFVRAVFQTTLTLSHWRERGLIFLVA